MSKLATNDRVLSTRPVKFLQFITFCMLIGRAWQCIFWDIPIRGLLWDEELLSGVVPRLTGLSWQEYVTSPKTDLTIFYLIKFFGIFLGVTALATCFVKAPRKWIKHLLVGSFVFMILLSFLYMKEKFYHVGQLIEHSSQAICPLLLVFVIYKNVSLERLTSIMKIVVAFTFFGHGLYALGYYPRPGMYVDLVINLFGFSEAIAHEIIFYAGVFDIAVAILVFFPQTQRAAALYMVFWGGITALSRFVSNFDSDFLVLTFKQYLHEVVFRVPHFGIPLLLYYLPASSNVKSLMNMRSIFRKRIRTIERL